MAFHGAYSYDVFLSYRGTDTKNFTGHLINSLRQKGLHPFKDDEFERGESISPVLVDAIEGSKVSIVVFSENYAESRWCLDELVQILECRERGRQLVRPIFFRVDPSVVRNQKGSYGEAMNAHAIRFKDNLKKVESWREALTKAADLGGWHFSADGFEPDFVQEVIEEVSRQLTSRACLYVAKHPVGLESRKSELNSLLDIGNKDDVRVIAVYGPEGVGKTTIAKAVYNSIAYQFEGSSFLANVSGYSKERIDLIQLQKILLSEILRETNLMVSSVDKGISIIQGRLSTKRVLLVLDDVNFLDQLHSLAGEPIQFGKGSRIIITTRNERLIRFLDIPSTSIYEVKKLDFHEALRLLCLYAFKSAVAADGYDKVAECAVHYTDGFPLKLVELGPRLYGRTIGEWTTELDSYKRHRSLEEKGKEKIIQETPKEHEILGRSGFHEDLYNVRKGDLVGVKQGPSTNDETKVKLLGQETRSLSLNGSLHANHLALQPSDSYPSNSVTFEMQEGIYVEIGDGSKSFKQEKWKGKRSSMIKARGHSIVRGSEPTFWRSLPESRIFEDAELNYVYSLDIKGKIDTNMSEKTTYGAYLIFKFISPQHSFAMKPVDLSVKLEGDKDLSDDSQFLVRLSKVQGDGWMEIEIGEFFNNNVEDGSMVCTNIEIDSNVTKAGLVVQGIEIRPKDRMRSETDSTSLTSLDELRSLSLSSPTSESTDFTIDRFLFMDDPEVDLEPDLPLSSFFNFASKKDDFVHLYHHTKLIENGNLRIAEDKSSGKICCMVSARGLTISWSDRPTYWTWISIPHSRFPTVAKLNTVYWFNIEGMIETQCLSPRTTYAAYFLFKFEGLISGFREQPLKLIIKCEGSQGIQERNILLDPPQNAPQLCQRREDGWMEINMGEFFINGDDSGKIKCGIMEHDTSIRKRGLIVEGIEFRPKES